MKETRKNINKESLNRDWILIIQCQKCGCIHTVAMNKDQLHEMLQDFDKRFFKDGICESCHGKGKNRDIYLAVFQTC